MTRRVIAFMIDIQVVMLAIILSMNFIVLILEAVATGEFQWSYSRNHARWTDLLQIPIFLSGFWIMFWYFMPPAHAEHQPWAST